MTTKPIARPLLKYSQLKKLWNNADNSNYLEAIVCTEVFSALVSAYNASTQA